MARTKRLISLAIASLITASCQSGVAVPGAEVEAPSGSGDTDRSIGRNAKGY